MAINFRGLFASLLPGRFTNGDGEKVLFSLALIKDAYVTRVRAGLEARMPTRAGKSALLLIGQDRGIPRGRAEDAKHYANRLLGWRFPRGHRVRGSAFAALDQIGEYFGGLLSWSIDAKRNYHQRTAAGVTSFSYGFPWDWDGTGAVPNWGRFWIVIVPGADVPTIKAWAAFGDPFAVVGAGVGQQDLGLDDANAIRALFKGEHPWKPSGTRAEWLIVNLDGTTQTPDGTWLHWSKDVAGVRVATRYAGWRYISLFPGNNDYTGDDSKFSTTFPLVDGGTYVGNDANFPTTFTMPDGSTYTGNPANFPTSFRLIDDGDRP